MKTIPKYPSPEQFDRISEGSEMMCQKDFENVIQIEDMIKYYNEELVSLESLKSMDQAVENFKIGKVSDPIHFSSE